ncbi:alanine dehydrogenase [Paraburkholderia sp. CNPSo 3157]|uniref:Alanine dehydrogenase n=1 Tax=Paraburkholderia franconis TaxID=2654983 RepID=A0A7X1TJ10_9BURK|nr:alanine dehydrogenase [Paraburkholderia franconis]MPW20804.1 alanine dehydrogenase [Paraburkholderia franconis]
MHIGVPKEIKNHEYRVGLTPSSVREIVAHGHTVSVETGAGAGIGASDDAYRAAGAQVTPDAQAIFSAADMIVKVKEPQARERAMLREGQILFTYLHLAPDPQQCADLVKSNAVCIAYETVTQPGGGLPLLAPMSEVAGRMSIQAGAFCLERAHGGKGILLGGVAGVPSAKIVILGGGVVGSNAAQIAVGTGAQVVVIDRNVDVLRRMDRLLGARVVTVYSNQDNIEQHVLDADLVIGGVLVPGAAAPRLVTRKMVEAMRPGSAIVDVAIDQGGCCETAKATTHAEPTYKVGEVVHYCVANMPGGVPRTSTYALNNATLPFVLQIADKGWRKALTDDEHLRRGLNVALGKVTCPEVATALSYACEDAGAVAAG